MYCSVLCKFETLPLFQQIPSPTFTSNKHKLKHSNYLNSQLSPFQAVEDSKKDGIAERLYSELPETSFTRSISNPEAVMRRRRQQILEQKLKQFCQEGGTDAGKLPHSLHFRLQVSLALDVLVEAFSI